DPADGLGDVGRVQARGGHLVEEGLEDVMVAPVDDRHVHGQASEAGGRAHTAEAGSDDDDLRTSHAEIVGTTPVPPPRARGYTPGTTVSPAATVAPSISENNWSKPVLMTNCVSLPSHP